MNKTPSEIKYQHKWIGSTINRNISLDIPAKILYNLCNIIVVSCYVLGGIFMNRRIKGILSTMCATVMCTACVSALAANSGMIIDHDCRGIENGYCYEYANNDSGSKPVLDFQTGGSFTCSWDNKNFFTASKGLRFAEAVDYKSLGKISVNYWRRIENESFYDKEKGFVRFGIRLHNANGDTFTILESDASANGSALTDDAAKYKKLTALKANDTYGDNIGSVGISGTEGMVSKDVDYTIYSCTSENKKGTSYICRRNETLAVNNDNDDFKTVKVSDKLDALTLADQNIGKITDITFFVESSYSKGSADIAVNNIFIENMPELAPDTDESNETCLSNYFTCERGGYYYLANDRGNGKLTITEPSQFKAEWDTHDNPWCAPVYECGKLFDNDADSKNLMESKIKFKMELDIDGIYFIASHAMIENPETADSYNETEIYIIDALKNWSVPQESPFIDVKTIDGETYDIYYTGNSYIGTGKGVKKSKYYFVNRNAKSNAANGTITVDHELAPFLDCIPAKEYVNGKPESLCAYVHGGSAKGTAKLVSNEVTIPDKPLHVYDAKRVDVNNDSHYSGRSQQAVGDKIYYAGGYEASMKGYTDKTLKCVWDSPITEGYIDSPDHYGIISFAVRKVFDTFSVIDFTGSRVYEGKEPLQISYSIDLGKQTNLSKRSQWLLGGTIECFNNNYLYANSDPDVTSFIQSRIIVADKVGEKLTSFFSYCGDDIKNPEDIGSIVSGGVKYNVKLVTDPKNNYATFFAVRDEEIAPVKADDTAEGCERYENSFIITDILSKIKTLGYDPGGIMNAEFTLYAHDTKGEAVINYVDIKAVSAESKEYTAEDVRIFQDFILGKSSDIPADAEYDLNGDGTWDTFDLCLMRKAIAK